jgi:bifunctional non-homologous end joining protein LigD
LCEYWREATRNPGRANAVQHSQAYGAEFKWDGVRAITYLDGKGADGVRVISRNDLDVTATYPELRELADAVTRPVIVDGEIVAVRDGRPDFGLLQSRMHHAHPGRALLHTVPVSYYIFDLLHLDDRSLPTQTYTRRRELLADQAIECPAVQTTPWYPSDQLPAADVLTASLNAGLEGVVVKPLNSHYHPGKRRDWLKVKNRDDPPRPQTRDAHWVRPEIVGEVSYSERTPGGHLRHPAWRGHRPDLDPADVRWE